MNSEKTSPELQIETHIRHRFDAIVNQRLMPETIDHYAENALNEVIEVVNDVVLLYRGDGGMEHVSSDTERSALVHCGLNPVTIEDTLDHIADISENIKQLSSVIDAITVNTGRVITPPDHQELQMSQGDGSFKEKPTIPRLKTLLFLASNSFGIDLQDPAQLSVTAGVLKETMVRNESYNLVELSTVNRSILICDEEGNATFVLDTNQLIQHGISREVLMGMSKNELQALLSQHEGLGIRLIYTHLFVENLISLMETIPGQDEAIVIDESAGKLLQVAETAPEGVLTARGLYQKLRVHSKTLTNAIETLSEDLGETKLYRFANRNRIGYTPEQQKIIEDYLEASGVLVGEAEEGALSFTRLREHFGVAKQTLQDAIGVLADEIGEVRMYRVGSKRRPVPAYTPRQQEVIANYLGTLDKLKFAPSEGVLSVRGIMQSLGKDWQTVHNAITSLGDELGEVTMYKFYSKTVPGYDIRQQAMIKEYMGSKDAAEVPEGFLSLSQLATELGTSWGVLSRVVDAISDQIGETTTFKVGNEPRECYSSEQQQQIYDYLNEKGYFAEKAPADYVTTSRMARNLKISHNLIKDALELLGDELGELQSYRFNGAYRIGLDSYQQQKIMEFIGQRSAAQVDLAPNGIVSAHRIAQQLGVDKWSVTKAVESLADELGEVGIYRFRRVATKGYDDRQQALIKKWISQNIANRITQ